MKLPIKSKIPFVKSLLQDGRKEHGYTPDLPYSDSWVEKLIVQSIPKN